MYSNKYVFLTILLIFSGGFVHAGMLNYCKKIMHYFFGTSCTYSVTPQNKGNYENYERSYERYEQCKQLTDKVCIRNEKITKLLQEKDADIFKELMAVIPKLPHFGSFTGLSKSWQNGFKEPKMCQDEQTKERNQKIIDERTQAYKAAYEKSNISSFVLAHLLALYNRMSKNYFTFSQKWVDEKNPDEKIYNNPNSFFNYVMTVRVPAQTRIILIGDPHADVKTVSTMFDHYLDENYKVKDKDTVLVICGDMTDRGITGTEMLYYAAYIKMLNPTQVYLVKGNHEDFNVNTRFGFADELAAKYEHNAQDNRPEEDQLNDHIKTIKKFYNALPVAIFFGTTYNNETNYLLACHGCIDSRYNPAKLFKAMATHKENHRELYELYPQQCNRIEQNKRTQELVQSEHNKNAVLHNLQESNTHDQKVDYTGNNQLLYNQHFQKQACSNLDVEFLWQNINADPDQKLPFIMRKGYMGAETFIGKEFVDTLLTDWRTYENGHTSQVVTVFRAHQHKWQDGYNSCQKDKSRNHEFLMPALLKGQGMAQAFTNNVTLESDCIQKGSLYTLMAAPDNIFGQSSDDQDNEYPGFNYSTCVEVTTQNGEKGWTHYRKNKAMFEKPAYRDYKSIIDGQQVTTYLKYHKDSE